jgi:uncharacterized C2H2 Zn-finger protein
MEVCPYCGKFFKNLREYQIHVGGHEAELSEKEEE